MIDFHSHILPSVDDGSSSVEESIEMLRMSYCGGIREMVATPHFYAQKEAPERFLERREKAWERLAPVLPEDTPKIYLGAEVCYYAGISNTDSLPQLCMEQSRLLLLEMPFQRWTERMMAEVVDVAQDRGLTVLLAFLLTMEPLMMVSALIRVSIAAISSSVVFLGSAFATGVGAGLGAGFGFGSGLGAGVGVGAGVGSAFGAATGSVLAAVVVSALGASAEVSLPLISSSSAMLKLLCLFLAIMKLPHISWGIKMVDFPF